MFLSCQPVPLRCIAPSEEWNLHPWELQQISPDLVHSFRQIGILHPPIVRQEPGDRFTIINGFKRLRFIQQETDCSQATCMVVDGSAPYTYLLEIIISDRSSGSPLSLAEKARFVAIASRVLSPKEILDNYHQRLGLRKSPLTISMLLKILEQDESIVKEVHRDRLGDKIVMELLNLADETDRIVLVSLFRRLAMGDGKQKRFFSMLRENASRADISISAYLDREEIRKILNHKEMNVPQKIHHLGIYLQQQMTPSLARAEEDFSQQVSKMRLPPDHVLTHAQSFEKDEVTLSITFNNLSDCREYLERNHR